MGKEVFRRQVVGPFVVAGPSNDDALIVDLGGPSGRIIDKVADGAVHLVPLGVDRVAIRVADGATCIFHDGLDLLFQRGSGTGTAREPHEIRPGGDLDLTVRVRIDLADFLDHGVGDLVAKLVRVTGQNHLAHTYHAGNPVELGVGNAHTVQCRWIPVTGDDGMELGV